MASNRQTAVTRKPSDKDLAAFLGARGGKIPLQGEYVSFRPPTAPRATPCAGDGLTLTLPPEQIEAIAQRAAEIVAERQQSDGWLRGAEAIGNYLDCGAARIYALSSGGRIPVERDGSALIARKSDLDAWVRAGGGKRP